MVIIPSQLVSLVMVIRIMQHDTLQHVQLHVHLCKKCLSGEHQEPYIIS